MSPRFIIRCPSSTTGLRNQAELVCQLSVAALCVVDDVRLDVFVQVAFLQYASRGGCRVVDEKLFVCAQCRIKLPDVGRFRLFAVYDTYLACAVFGQFRVAVGLHDARLV